MKLENVVPWGRNLEEYKAMFALSDRDLCSNILGCGDGPSSFNKELTVNNGSVISIDPVYKFTEEEIHQKILDTSKTVMKQVEQTKDNYVWKNIGSVDELESIRMSAMWEFLKDYTKGKKEKRYIEASLPNLPFQNKSFDLVLCSHFLFLYSEHFNLDFHIDSILEMCRVGKEVRVFPLLDLKGNRSGYLGPLVKRLEQDGYQCQIERVDYEFQKSGNEMLRVTSI